MKILTSIENWVLKIEKVVMGLTVGTLVFAVTAQVFFRYVIRISMPWTEELSIMAFFFAVMYGAAYAVRYDRHLGIISITSRMSEKTFIMWWYIKKAIVLFFIGYVMFIQAIPIAHQGWAHTYTIIQIPSFYILVQIPICAALMVFHTVMSILRKDYIREYAVQKASAL